MNETEKLKPCPFCGGKAMIEVIEPHTHTLATFMPDCEGRTFIECQCGAAISGETEFAAIAAWNRRAEQNPKPLTLDELREMDGEPVWIEENGETKCGVVSLEGNCLEKEPVITLANGNFYLLKEYNSKTWLAYRTKPEGGK